MQGCESSSDELVELLVLPTLVQLLQCTTAALDINLGDIKRKFLPIVARGAVVAELWYHSLCTLSSVLRVDD